MSAPKEVAELIAGSGNNFHAKVARWLQSDGWHISVSPYYMDQTQNKAREIDLIAEKAWPIKSFGDFKGEVVVRLFVECKFVPSYSVFWFTSKDTGEAQRIVCSGGIFREGNTYTKEHHYLAKSQEVAKLFASNSQKGQEGDPFYKALNQVLNALVSMRGKESQLKQRHRYKTPTYVMNFPVVVCSSFEKLWAVDFYSESSPKKISENFQLEVRYAYTDSQGRDRDDYFLLDFVDFSNLSDFSSVVTRDAEVAAFFKSDD